MKNNRLFIILAIALLVAVSRIHLKNIASQQRLESSQFKAYIALETNSPETAELSQNIFYQLGRRIKNQWTAVDIFAGYKVQNLYSHAARRRDLEALSGRVNVTPSSDGVLIQAIQRYKDEVEQNKQQSFYGFIFSKGTSNPSTLVAIRQICQKLAQTNSTKMHITIIVSIEKENLTFEEILLLGAICLTPGAKRTVIRWVKATRSYEPKRNFNNDERYANPFASRVRLSLAYRWFLIFISVYLGVH